MKLSPFQAILLGVFVVGALVGLFVFATFSSKGTTSNAVGTVVIWGTLPGDGMRAALTEAAKVDQTLKNVSYVEKDAATLPSDIATAIATGAAPDLVLASQEELHPLSKFIQPIPLSTISANTFESNFLQEGNLFAAPGGAGYFGIPFLVDPLVLFSNRSILSSAGIAKPPATWEALVGLVPNIAVLTPTRQITRGLIALGSYDNVHSARAILSALFLQQGIPLSGYSANGALAASLGGSASGGSSPGSSVLGFYTQFSDPSKVSYTWNSSLPDSAQMFVSGDLALCIDYASRAGFFRAANPNLDFIVTPIPQSATAPGKKTYGLVYAFMIPNGAKNASGAYQAAVLLTNSAEQEAAASATGLAPATVNELAKAPPADPVAEVAYAEALTADGWLSPAPADTNRVFSGMIEDVTSGRSMPDTALSDAENALTALLQR
ncbi:MAG: extracellular solute-binding protein [Patescibacteria group bacterium]|nr:extracellular solute-binding protein [Patescibacteria group bacterium]